MSEKRKAGGHHQHRVAYQHRAKSKISGTIKMDSVFGAILAHRGVYQQTSAKSGQQWHILLALGSGVK